jgi:molybdenum cofactor cytidylyltransferase
VDVGAHVTPDAPVAAIVLAAGASVRMGSPKQLLPSRDGTPLVAHAAATALAAGLSPVVVVLGAQASIVREALTGLAVQDVVCTAWADGMHQSIASGVAQVFVAATPAGADEGAPPAALIVMTCDQPDTTPDDLRALVAVWRASGTPMVATSHDGAAGVPALFARDQWDALSTLPAGEGARTLLRAAGGHVALHRPARAATRDLDTRADYDAWRAAE